MRSRSRLIAATLAVTLSACGLEPPELNTPAEQFDSFWSTFDRNYSYFAYKHINWDSLRAVFRPRALAASSEAALVDVLKEMVAPLRDVHVRFNGPDGRSYPTYVPATTVNFDENAWRALTTACGFVQPKPGFGHCSMNGIAYVFIRTWNSDNFIPGDLDAVVDLYRDAPGMIIDVRPNGGGSDQLALSFAGRFASTETTTGYVRFRDGPRHDDFGAEIPRRLSPRGPFRFSQPVIVLAGRGVFSSNETFISAMRELPSVTILGDTTGGSSGNPAQHLLKTWRYWVPRWIEWTADRRVIEWNGIPPDSVVRWDASEVAAGRDPVLAVALARLRVSSTATR